MQYMYNGISCHNLWIIIWDRPLERCSFLTISLCGSTFTFNSVQFSCSVMSNSSWPHGLQHTRPPCPSPTPRVYSNSCPLRRWCHPTISSCHPLLLQPSIFPSIRVFSNELVLHIRWPKYWSFNFSISPSNEYLGLISFRMDWLDLLAVQGTLKSLLQHHSSKASILWHSAFFIVQLISIHDYWKNHTRWTRWTLHTHSQRHSHTLPCNSFDLAT